MKLKNPPKPIDIRALISEINPNKDNAKYNIGFREILSGIKSSYPSEFAKIPVKIEEKKQV